MKIKVPSSSITENNLKSLRISSAICVIAGNWSLIFEIYFFHDWSLETYFARLIFTFIAAFIYLYSFRHLSQTRTNILIHLLLLALISSFAFTIYKIPNTLFINSQILSLLIFTTALMFSWEVKNQIVVAIYYNVLFAGSILLVGKAMFHLPNIFSMVIFVSMISILSVMASGMNYKLRNIYHQKSEENNFLVNSVPLGICRTDTTGNIITANKYLTQLLSISTNDKSCKLFDYLISEKLQEYFIAGINQPIELEIEHEIDGETKYLSVIGDVITDNSTAKSYRFIIQDKTESIFIQQEKEKTNKRLFDEILEKEKILQQALLQKNQKLQLLSKINHEVRTPLNAILLFHEMVDDNILKSIEEIKKYSKTVKNSSRYLLNTINNFIDYAKMETGKMDVEKELFNIREEIEDVIELLKPLARDKNILLNLIIQPSSLNLVFTDEIKYRQVLINLIANSIKYTNKGSVTVILHNDHIDGYRYAITTIIEDTGVGISPDQLDCIFDPFVSYKKEEVTQYSSGLGLAICKEFVQMLGGDIKVESTVGAGSKFTVTIPYECDLSIQPDLR